VRSQLISERVLSTTKVFFCQSFVLYGSFFSFLCPVVELLQWFWVFFVSDNTAAVHTGDAGLVSCGQTAFFRFSLWWRKRGSGDLTMRFACDKIARFWQVLIADDEPKRGAKDLWDYISQLYICINSRNQCKLRETCISRSYRPHLVVILIKACSALYLKALTRMWLKTKYSIAYITDLPLPVGKEIKTSLPRQNWYSYWSFFKL